MAIVEYRLSAPALPLCILRKCQSGVLKKIPITNEREWDAMTARLEDRQREEISKFE